MFRQRALVFAERLGSRAHIVKGREIDELDALDPLYVVAWDELSRRVKGSFRCLPTCGPTLLKSDFGRQFGHAVTIESPRVWESSRFVIAPHLPRQMTKVGACETTVALMIAQCALGLDAEINQVRRLLRRSTAPRFRRIGWAPQIIAVAADDLAVGCWDVDERVLKRMVERHGFRPVVMHASLL